MFNVYSTPWFAAIYLLLAVSLIGCIIPRTKVHWKAMRSGPPKMPRNIKLLPAHRNETLDASPEAVAQAAREVLRPTPSCATSAPACGPRGRTGHANAGSAP